MLIFLKPPLGKRIDGWESGSSGFQLLLSKSPTNVQPYRWRNLLQAIHHLQFRPAKKKVLWAVVVETHDLQQENHLQVKYFGDSLGLFAANSEWPRISLSCPGIVSFCQAFRTSASCQLETNHNITLSFKELPAACTQERCSTCQRSMHVLCQVMLVCKTHVLKRYLISWLYVYKVRFKELDSSFQQKLFLSVSSKSSCFAVTACPNLNRITKRNK